LKRKRVPDFLIFFFIFLLFVKSFACFFFCFTNFFLGFPFYFICLSRGLFLFIICQFAPFFFDIAFSLIGFPFCVIFSHVKTSFYLASNASDKIWLTFQFKIFLSTILSTGFWK